MERLRLGVDLRCLPADGSAGGGIAHAARAITEALERNGKHNVVRYAVHGNRHVLIDAMKKQPCDVLFVPSGAVSPGLPVPAIPWVHDLDIFDHPEWFPQPWLKRKITTSFFLRGIRAAPHVFAVSEYTKQAIIRHARIPADRITVTGEGGDAMLAAIPREELVDRKREARERLNALGITRKFVLVLGTLEPRKNIPLICRAWPEVAKKVSDVDLVIAGQDGWKVAPIHRAILESAAASAGMSHVLLWQRPRDNGRAIFTEDDRRDLLLAASLVCVPSFSEGFGLVALEATQAGTPVLASRRGALPEVLGEGPWLLDPTDATTWQEEMISALKGRSRMISALGFSWEKTADSILKKV